MGKNQGYRCEKCGGKYAGLKKKETTLQRPIDLGLYVTSTRSQRHLTKPLRRYGKEKKCYGTQGLIRDWHS
jgi:tRNA(Ile2) C34 agmatinyltransferase TiaS